MLTAHPRPCGHVQCGEPRFSGALRGWHFGLRRERKLHDARFVYPRRQKHVYQQKPREARGSIGRKEAGSQAAEKHEKIRQQLFRLPVLRRKAGRLPGDSCERGVFPCGGRQLFRRCGADCRRTRGTGRPQGGAQQITADGAVRGAFRKEPRGGIAAQDFRREQCRLWATDGDFCGCRLGRHAAPFLTGV